MTKLSFIFTIFLALTPFAGAVNGDVKIKSRQTMSGQSYENTTYIKGKRQRSESMNGAMVTITQCDLRRGIQINSMSKTYMVNPMNDTTQTITKTAAGTPTEKGATPGGVVTTTITTKDTGERKQMFGYTAKHLVITMVTESSPDSCNKTKTKMQTDGWYIDAAFVLDCDLGYQSFNNSAGTAGGCRDRYNVKTIGTVKRGYPVYETMTMFDEKGKPNFTMVNEVVELSSATLASDLFEIPVGYREVSDASQMYASSAYTGDASPGSKAGTSSSSRAAGPASTVTASAIGSKNPGAIRIGLAEVKTGAVGADIDAADLSTAVRNTFAKFLKTSNIEVVSIDGETQSAVTADAANKECDYVIFSSVSHKKGGGGFGMFGAALGSAVAAAGIGHTGSTAGNIAGQIATQSIVSAASLSSDIKNKDEITLELNISKTGGVPSPPQIFKAKARSNGEDLISRVVEQASRAVVGSLRN